MSLFTADENRKLRRDAGSNLEYLVRRRKEVRMKTPALFIVSMVASTFLASCKAPENKVGAEVSPEAKIVAQQNQASYVGQIGFRRGSSDLTQSARATLDHILDEARRTGTIQNVKVISWADAEYPSADIKSLSAPQRQLADRRNQKIDAYVKALESDIQVDEYNMASRPNAVQRLLTTSDSRLKNSLEDAGIPHHGE